MSNVQCPIFVHNCATSETVPPPFVRGSAAQSLPEFPRMFFPALESRRRPNSATSLLPRHLLHLMNTSACRITRQNAQRFSFQAPWPVRAILDKFLVLR